MSIPAEIVLVAVAWLGLPIWYLLALVVDLFRGIRRLATVRLVTLVLLLTAIEFTALVMVGVVTIATLGGRIGGRARSARFDEWVFGYWINGVYNALGISVGLRMVITGEEEITPGPIIVAGRHASYADAALPAWLLLRAGLEPRYSLTRELLYIPCMDIVGLRQGHCFVDRSGADTTGEVARLEALVADLDDRQAAVIFPEGRFRTATRAERALEKVRSRSPERADRLAALGHLMPVLPGGILAYLRAAPDADLVLIRHVGFEPFGSFRAFVENLPFTRPVVVRCERIARAEIPLDDDGRLAWLDERWLAIDTWTARQGQVMATTPRSPSLASKDEQ